MGTYQFGECMVIAHFAAQPGSAAAPRNTQAWLGALLIYMDCMLALFRLRKRESQLECHSARGLYPFAPVWTLACTAVCIASLVYFNRLVAVLFACLLAIGYLGLRLSWRGERARRTSPMIVEKHSQP
jgi:ethanolamine permease